MKARLLTLFVALVFSGATAQEYAFKVLANKGANEVKSGNEWAPVKTGASLKNDDELKLSPNSYMGLVHATGKPLELKQPGSYKVSELASQMKTGTSVLTKYTDFILSSNSAETKKNRLSATGAVDRGENAAIQLILPQNQHSGIYNSNATISWAGTKVAGPYIVTVRNMFDDAQQFMPAVEVTENENSYLVSVDLPGMKKPRHARGLQVGPQLSRIDKVVLDRITRPNDLRFFQTRNHPHEILLQLRRQRGRESVQINFVRIVTFRLEKKLVPRLV